jgi:2',3'-cyclic-nucleotide 2'-phosphodiesterase (5'-nucleotidase family)
MRTLALVIAAATALAAPANKLMTATNSPAKSARDFNLTVLYTCSAKGQIRSCNCTKFRFGGYGRAATLVSQIREKSDCLVLLEGGDALEWTGFQAEMKAEVTGKALKLMAYDAMIPGEDEVGKSGSQYIEQFDKTAAPVVCANYSKDGDNKPTYSTYRVIKTKSGLRVGVIGLLSPSVGRLFQEADFASKVTDPRKALKPALAQASKEADAIILVYHGPLSEAEKLATRGIDLILATHRTSRDVLFPEKGAESNEVDAPVKRQGDTVLVNAETNANWSLGRIDLHLKQGRAKSAKHKLLYLDRRYDEHPEMVKVYDDYNQKVKSAVLAQSGQLKTDAEALLKKRGLNLEQMRARLRKSPFVTAGKCKECHPEIYEIWTNSRHAKAMDTLKKTNQEFDPECVSCHATGVMIRNGFANMKDTPELANVQCEACHGPAEQHLADTKKPYGEAGEMSCRACHTDERTPEFDYEQAWAQIMH